MVLTRLQAVGRFIYMRNNDKGAEMTTKINLENPNHIYLDDEVLDMLKRAGVQQSRIDAMRATREAATWTEVAA